MSETITGKCEAITEKGDWTTFEIDVGSQYPVRLATKVPELVELGRAAKGQLMDWTFNAMEGKINEKSGKPYINRYFEGVAPPTLPEPGGLPGATPTVSGNAPASQARYSDDEVARFEAKERRDYRSRAWAQTIAAFTHTIKVEEPVEDVFKRLQPFQRAVFTDVCQSFAYPVVDEDENLPFG